VPAGDIPKKSIAADGLLRVENNFHCFKIDVKGRTKLPIILCIFDAAQVSTPPAMTIRPPGPVPGPVR